MPCVCLSVCVPLIRDLAMEVICPLCSLCASQNVGFTLSIPIISAGSFGLSCDDKPNLTRLLPPAHKVSSFFQHFWNVTGNHIKRHEWETAYVFKREDNSEECFW